MNFMFISKFTNFIKSPVKSMFSKRLCYTKSTLIHNDLKILDNFVNRNPRNLEFLGIAKKKKGWNFQYPNPGYYHCLFVERTNRNIIARVQHTSGKTVLSASTIEIAIARVLKSKVDLAAARFIGKVLGRRCLESGITSMIVHDGPASNINAGQERFEACLDALKQEGITFTEPEEFKPEYEAGIDYDNDEQVKNVLHGKIKNKKRIIHDTIFTPLRS